MDDEHSQITHQKHQMTGYYKAKKGGLRGGKGRLDRRRRTDRQLLQDRADFKRLCGRKNYGLRRREAWKIVEKFKRVLNAVEPVVFGLESLVNKRSRVIMPLAIDYMRLVNSLQDAIRQAFDGLPDTRPGPDIFQQIERARKREAKAKANGKDGDTPAQMKAISEPEQ